MGKIEIVFKSGFSIDMSTLIDESIIENDDDVIAAVRPEEFIMSDNSNSIKAKIIYC